MNESEDAGEVNELAKATKRISENIKELTEKAEQQGSKIF
jgi:hypothetical protein